MVDQLKHYDVLLCETTLLPSRLPVNSFDGNELSERLSNLHGEVCQLIDCQLGKDKKYSESLSVLDEKFHSTRHELLSVRLEVKALNMKVQEHERQFASQSTTIAQLEKELFRKDSEIEAIREVLTSEKDIYNGRAKAYERELFEVKKRFQLHTTDSKIEIDGMKLSLEKQVEEIKIISLLLEGEKNTSTSLHHQLITARNEFSASVEEATSLRCLMDVLREEKTACDTELSHLRRTNSALLSSLSQSEKFSACRQEECDQHRSQISELENNLVLAEHMRESLCGKILQLDSEVQNWKKEYCQRDEKSNSELALCSDSMFSMQKLLSQKDTALKEKSVLVEQLETRLAEMAARIDCQNDEISRLCNQFDALKIENDLLEKDLRQSRQELASSQQESLDQRVNFWKRLQDLEITNQSLLEKNDENDGILEQQRAEIICLKGNVTDNNVQYNLLSSRKVDLENALLALEMSTEKICEERWREIMNRDCIIQELNSKLLIASTEVASLTTEKNALKAKLDEQDREKHQDREKSTSRINKLAELFSTQSLKLQSLAVENESYRENLATVRLEHESYADILKLSVQKEQMISKSLTNTVYNLDKELAIAKRDLSKKEAELEIRSKVVVDANSALIEELFSNLLQIQELLQPQHSSIQSNKLELTLENGREAVLSFLSHLTTLVNTTVQEHNRRTVEYEVLLKSAKVRELQAADDKRMFEMQISTLQDSISNAEKLFNETLTGREAKIANLLTTQHELQKSSECLEAEVSQLKELLLSKTKECCEVSDLREQLSGQLQEVLTDNQQQLFVLNSQLSELQLMLSNEKGRSSQLSCFIEDERVRFSSAIAEAEDKMNRNFRELQSSNDRMIQSESVLQQQVFELKGTLKDKELDVLSLRSELATLSDKDALVMIAMKNMEAHLQELTASIQSRECALDEQANRYQRLQQDFSELGQKNIILEKKAFDVSTEIGNLAEKFAIVCDENSALISAMKEKQLQLLQATDHISSLQVALTERSEQLQTAQRCSVDNVKEIDTLRSLLENANTAANADKKRIVEMNSLLEDMERKCSVSLQQKDRACEMKLQEFECRNIDEDLELEIKLRDFEVKNRDELVRLTKQCDLDRQELESCKVRLCEFETEKTNLEQQLKSGLSSFKDACRQADEVIAAKEVRLKELSKLAETQVIFI